MHIKKFRAGSISEALAMVKQELGEDAVIMHTGHRQVRDPSTGRKKRVAEVVAAMDFDALEAGKPAGRRKSPIIKKQSAKNRPAPVSFIGASAADSFGVPDAKEAARDESDPRDHEIGELKEMLKEAISALNEMKRADIGGSMSQKVSVDNDLISFFRQLDIPGVMQEPLKSRMMQEFGADDFNRNDALAWLRNYAERNIRTVPEKASGDTPLWLAFIGPTGVGKTTTLAKLAAIRKYLHNEKGLMVSVDTYRLGAMDQLKQYGELTDIPVCTAVNHSELLKIFAANRDKDFIFVDTTGRSPVMSEHINELRRLFDALPGLYARALLCATFKAEDMKDIISLYRKLPVKGWIISKTDETRHYSSLFLPLLGYQLPITHITNGQRVPEDIREADRISLMKMLFPCKVAKINPQLQKGGSTRRVTSGRPVSAYLENV